MMRGMCGWYLTGMPHAAHYKNLLTQINTLKELEDILVEYRNIMNKQR